MSTDTQTRPDFWSRLGHGIGWFFGFLLRLMFVSLLAAAFGAGIYYGIPYAYATLVQPVQANANQIVVVGTRVDNLKTSLDASQAAQDSRLTALETQSDSQRQRLDAVESDTATTKKGLDAEQAARDNLASQVAGLKDQLATQAEAAAQLRTDLDSLKPATTAATDQVARLERQVTLLRLQNALLNAHIQVVAQNLGDARGILTTTVTAMQAFITTPGVFSSDATASLSVRLVTAGALIEPDPVTALSDLESVWAQMDRALNGTP